MTKRDHFLFWPLLFLLMAGTLLIMWEEHTPQPPKVHYYLGDRVKRYMDAQKEALTPISRPKER